MPKSRLQSFLAALFLLEGVLLAVLEISALIAFGGSTLWSWRVVLLGVGLTLLLGWGIARFKPFRSWAGSVCLIAAWAAQPFLLKWLQHGWAQLVVAPERSSLLYAQALVRTFFLTIGLWGAVWYALARGISQWRLWRATLLLLTGLATLFTVRRLDLSGAAGAFGLLANRDSGYAAKPTASPVEGYGRITFAPDGRPLAMEQRFLAATTLQTALPLLVRPRAQSGIVMGDCPEIHRSLFHSLLASQPRTNGYDIILYRQPPAWKWPTLRHPTPRNLAPDGLLAIVLDVRPLDPPALAQELAFWRKRYAHAQLWQTSINDYLLLLSNAPFDLPLGNMLLRYAEPALMRALAAAGLTSLPNLFAAYVAGTSGLDAYVTHHRDQKVASTIRLLFAREQGARILQSLPEIATNRLDWLQPGAGLNEQVYNSLLTRALAASGEGRQLAIATRLGDGKTFPRQANPQDPLILELVDRLELEAQRRQKLGDIPGAVKARAAILDMGHDTAAAHFNYAFSLRAKTDFPAALEHFRTAASKAPSCLEYHLAAAYAAEDAQAYRLALDLWRKLPERFPSVEGLRDQSELAQARILAADWEGRMPQEAIRLARGVCDRNGWKSDELSRAYADICILCGQAVEGVKIKQRLKQGL